MGDETRVHQFVPVPEDEPWYCTVSTPTGPCFRRAVIGCDGRGEDCTIGGDAWCEGHDPRRPSPTPDRGPGR